MSLDFSIWLIALVSVCFTTGIIAGFTIAHPVWHERIATTLNSFQRMRSKAKTNNREVLRCPVPVFDLIVEKQNTPCHLDGAAANAVQEFCKSMISRYGDTVGSVFIFGSRARGDFSLASDLDIAILFRESAHVDFHIQTFIWWLSFKTMLDHGLYLQVRILQTGSSTNSSYVQTIAREGIPVWTSC